ncbi:hypothetical protein EXIGLDRAFT_668139 [Exidia glandulosa HHB12029]|uniref:Tc1-like transposase DDE domain-containing protein n=1 Tax=Exidia glandulosa HHB12029 TaxID=1314781 RepID=A0A165MW06_EXIGL|nr:hypothetical protein EXIGLDRAFT_668139 [Exidia glandulosa HHB12029]
MLQAKNSKNIDTALELRLLSEYNILRERYRRDSRSDPSGAAALQVASTQPGYNRVGEGFSRGLSFARTIQRRAAYFLEHGELPQSTQGKGAKHESLLELPGMQDGIHQFIAGLGVGKINPRRLQQHVNTVLLPDLAPGKSVSEKTARKWLKILGYHKEKHKKGVYVDGHERSDNVFYRQGLFLPEIQVHENLSVKYDDTTGDAILPKLGDGEKRRHLIFHDECYFNANDRETTIWLKDGEQQLRQKGRGRGIHVSGFIYEDGGYLRLDARARAKHDALPRSEHLKTTDSMVIIYPGKNHDGWWDLKQLFAQIVDALDVFEYLHPEDQAVFIFDQSTAHAAYADDALVASRMQVGSGTKQPKMHDTRIPADNPDPNLRNKLQKMVTDDGHPKGMEIVLKERGLYDRIRPGGHGKPVGKCKNCSASETKRTELEKRAREALESDPELYGSLSNAMSVLASGSDAPIPDSGDEWCCMQKCLSLQKDFLAEKPKIQQYIEGRGHFCTFLPKFHCELNPIEMVWAYAKQKFRAEADGTFPTAKALVPKCLDAVSTTTIRHYFRRVYRYMDAYRKGLDAKQAAHAVKKYKSHRKLPESVMKDFDSDSD